MRGLLASPLGLLIGLSLGAFGGGGSILAVPALVYGAGEPAQVATSTSLLVVGIAALLGVGPHWREGRVRMAPGLLFGAAGIGGSALGTTLNRSVDPDLLLLSFSGVVVLAAAAMWQRKGRDEEGGVAPDEEATSDLPQGSRGESSTGVLTLEPAGGVGVASLTGVVVKVLLAGSVAGLLTGFFGVGGGFVIVPALVLSLGFPMPQAVGTSLVVIALNSAVALVLRIGSLDIRWEDAVPFLVLTVVGTVIGQRIADRLPAGTLTNGFVVLLLVIAVLTATSSLLALT